MARPKENLFLFAFNEKELGEIYQGLVIRDELTRKIEQASESGTLKKVGAQFTERSAHQLREQILELFDHYVDHEVDDQVMWQGIEDELKKRFDE